MNFIALDYNAAKEIVSAREFQTIDYSCGENLASELSLESNYSEIGKSIQIINTKNGKFFVFDNFDKKRIIVFDLTTFKGFEKNASERLLILQKTLRLAIKLWDNLGLSSSEKIISHTSYYLIMPFPFVVGNSYKIAIDSSPNEQRQDRRGTKHLLVFQDGIDISLTGQKTLLTVYKQMIDSIVVIEPNISQKVKNVECKKNYIETTGICASYTPLSPFMCFDTWITKLTDKQKSFVLSKRRGPDILTGAAGTGKTLCLVLRCYNLLKSLKSEREKSKILFVTHSSETRLFLEQLFQSLDAGCFLEPNSDQSLQITTLQNWCIQSLGTRVADAEYLDKDAMRSKETQFLYINEILTKFLAEDYQTTSRIISTQLKNYFETHDPWEISTGIQYEISTIIKGMAEENFEKYQQIPRCNSQIPLENDDDFKLIFYLFTKYNTQLALINQFDSDDIVISTLRDFDSPIWRRRRGRDGFDVIFVDETHLFNVSEIQLIYSLLKEDNNRIIFSMDETQAVGESPLSISKELHKRVICASDVEDKELLTVFRSSDGIIQLASFVLASGASLFSNIKNSLINATAALTTEELNLCAPPRVSSCFSEEEMYLRALEAVDEIAKKPMIARHQILIVPSNDYYFEKLSNFITTKQRLYVAKIESRGDISVVNNAAKNGAYVVGCMDYIGGLEFAAVVVIGMDEESFPPKNRNGNSNDYFRYASFNRLYVTVTRAKYQVRFLYEARKGMCNILKSAITETCCIEDRVK